jgi:hypothetical protein
VAAIDLAFVLAVLAFGWGLSLASYRLFAKPHGWPMGSWQRDRPGVAIAVGVLCMLLGAGFAGMRAHVGYPLSATAIPVFGLAWGIFWTGFLRVGAQSALLLGPVAAMLLLIRWLS